MDSLFGRIPQILVFWGMHESKAYVPVTEIEHEGFEQLRFETVWIQTFNIMGKIFARSNIFQKIIAQY